MRDYSIVLNQQKYTERWLDEIPIEKERSRKETLIRTRRPCAEHWGQRRGDLRKQGPSIHGRLLSEINKGHKGRVETL